MNSFELLINNGWTEIAPESNAEVISKKADKCFQYSNGKSTIISFMPYSTNGSYLIKLSHVRGGSPNFLEVKTTNEPALIEFINIQKEDADVNNYFGLYLNLQQNFEVSIVAWEQWEANYR